MNNVPELLVLQLLDQQEMYGYELVKAIKSVTGNSISVGESVIYPVLHSLEKSGALASRSLIVNGRTRVYYSLKKSGKRRLQSLKERWNAVRSGVDEALLHKHIVGASPNSK